ncbi:hypothetical protein AB0L65_37190 [Nonomuraea sp. NPDC052116]|uniref:hypothetical protein n=1 Tax=Nonomuraea sp. NPDC052116 TaxID=3155665 RepID=UPI003436365F
MNNPPDTSGAPGPSSPADVTVHKVAQRSENRRLLAMLTAAEHGILYLVSFALLALGVGILALMILTIVQGGASGAEKIFVCTTLRDKGVRTCAEPVWFNRP